MQEQDERVDYRGVYMIKVHMPWLFNDSWTFYLFQLFNAACWYWPRRPAPH